MPRVVIDTNIFYSLVGLSENIKVKNSNIEDYDITVSTPSLIESIVKYRADLISLKVCLKPILNNDYELVTIGHAPLDNIQIKEIYAATQLDQIQDTLDSILSFKIKRESEFLRFMFVGVAVGVLNILKESGHTFCDETNNRDLLALNTRTFIGNACFWFTEFETALTTGYANNNPTQAVSQTFTTNLSALLHALIINFHTIKCGFQVDTPESPVDFKKLTASLDQENILNKLNLCADNPLELFAKKINYNSIDNYLKVIDDELRELPSINEHAMDFLKQKLEIVFKNKAKIQKNDIFDFFIIYSLGLSDTLVATLDLKFLNILREVDQDSYSLCETLGFTK